MLSLYTSLDTDLQIYWFTDLLIYWFPDLLIYWFRDLLIFWHLSHICQTKGSVKMRGGGWGGWWGGGLCQRFSKSKAQIFCVMEVLCNPQPSLISLNIFGTYLPILVRLIDPLVSFFSCWTNLIWRNTQVTYLDYRFFRAQKSVYCLLREEN